MGGFHTVYRIRICPLKTNTTTSKYAFSPPLCGFASESKTPRLQKKGHLNGTTQDDALRHKWQRQVRHCQL
jgi:hypothetical protein